MQIRKTNIYIRTLVNIKTFILKHFCNDMLYIFVVYIVSEMIKITRHLLTFNNYGKKVLLCMKEIYLTLYAPYVGQIQMLVDNKMCLKKH